MRLQFVDSKGLFVERKYTDMLRNPHSPTVTLAVQIPLYCDIFIKVINYVVYFSWTDLCEECESDLRIGAFRKLCTASVLITLLCPKLEHSATCSEKLKHSSISPKHVSLPAICLLPPSSSPHPSTGGLTWLLREGSVLRSPNQHSPTQLMEYPFCVKWYNSELQCVARQ